MSDANESPSPSSTGAPLAVSRRTAMLELAGMVGVFAVPVGAALNTANPIPNPPSRKTLNFTPLPDPVAEQQERKGDKETRREDKKQRAGDDTRRSSRDEQQPPSATEQRASQP